ncbi:hypothetical protein NDU88_006608 [Pleurodeles waltl]|uniref:Uncharacterized protein n=1 Tax=Pleurodeles waltl TaxID=8319 RepID=A0AAV7RQQ6_PLEWA|nr:hypothetical protein NDU88_006608 [Pleurodeles waltl]
MATQRQCKKDSRLKDLFAKTPAKKQEPTNGVGTDPGGPTMVKRGEEDANPVMKAFMKQLFGVLCEHIPTLRQELATTVKELKGEAAELGQRVDTVERTCDAQ